MLVYLGIFLIVLTLVYIYNTSLREGNENTRSEEVEQDYDNNDFSGDGNGQNDPDYAWADDDRGFPIGHDGYTMIGDEQGEQGERGTVQRDTKNVIQDYDNLGPGGVNKHPDMEPDDPVRPPDELELVGGE